MVMLDSWYARRTGIYRYIDVTASAQAAATGNLTGSNPDVVETEYGLAVLYNPMGTSSGMPEQPAQPAMPTTTYADGSTYTPATSAPLDTLGMPQSAGALAAPNMPGMPGMPAMPAMPPLPAVLAVPTVLDNID